MHILNFVGEKRSYSLFNPCKGCESIEALFNPSTSGGEVQRQVEATYK